MAIVLAMETGDLTDDEFSWQRFGDLAGQLVRALSWEATEIPRAVRIAALRGLPPPRPFRGMVDGSGNSQGYPMPARAAEPVPPRLTQSRALP